MVTIAPWRVLLKRDIGLAQGAVSQSGAWYSYGDVRLGHGRASAIGMLRDSPELRYAIYNAALTAALAAWGLGPDLSPLPDAPPVEARGPQAAHLQPVDTGVLMQQAGFTAPAK